MIDLALLSALTDKPQSTDELRDLLKCTRRDLQYSRKRLEREFPILSDQRGMWICDDPIEYHYVIAHEIKLLEAAKSRIDDLESCLQHMWPEFQPRLFQLEEAV